MAVRPVRMGNTLVSVALQRQGGAAQPRSDAFGHKLRPIAAQYEPAIKIPGQPRFNRNHQVDARMSGDGQQTYGYVMFARADLTTAGIADIYQLLNARITGIDEPDASTRTEDYIVVRVDPRGHLPGGAILVKCSFEKHKDLVGSR